MKFAQVFNNKAHWIFESNEQPQFAPNIILVDITDNPDVQEGWGYDADTGVFTEPMLFEPEPTQPSERERIDVLEAENAELWFENLIVQAKVETHDQEIADLWFQTITGGDV